MATYNRARFIEESLSSIQGQTFEDWECIVIDDGSNDNTSEIISNYLETDNRFAYYKRSVEYKKGLSGCRNMGLDIAVGDYYIFYDDDDIVHPQNLEISLSYLKNPKNSFCNYQKQPFYNITPVPLELKTLKDPKPFSFEDIQNFVTGQRAMASCTVLWKQECFQNIRFNESLHYAEEWECYTKILTSGFKGVSIDEVLYYNRKHPQSNTGKFNAGSEREERSMLLAANLVLDRITENENLNSQLEHFFFRLGLQLKSYDLIKRVLNLGRADSVKRFKFLIGYQLYPIIKPIFKIKKRFLS